MPSFQYEKKWQKLWLKTGVFEPDFKRSPAGRQPFYNLMMFPYPSAEGLHVGNMYAFVGSDIYGRFKRMQGCDVFEPIGLDGFGIHSENYALKVKRHPVRQAKISEKNFYRQLEMIGNGFSWKEKLETYDPEYYKWTQWIFVQMFKQGLAYRKKQAVNWCPSCLTVLADEQAAGGDCERCGAKVIKKDLEQWFFKITKYAEELLRDLDKINWSEKVKIAQRNWIGRSEGAAIRFPISNPPAGGQNSPASTRLGEAGKFKIKEIEVFTTRPDTLFGATFMVISPELAQKWIETGWPAGEDVKKYISQALKKRGATTGENKEKTGIFSGVSAINPANQEKIPVWISDYVLAGYGTGAIMAVPAHDERDFEFARKFNLPIKIVIKPRALIEVEFYEGSGGIMNSGKFDGMDSEKAKWEITKFVGGERKVQYRLRDWLISRQRYWGPPIPMIFCDKSASPGERASRDGCGWQPVPEKDLPVRLPFIKDYRPRGTGVSPLARDPKFFKAKCPKCKGPARRETDVSDTFLDSAWYFFRYLDPKNKKEIFSKKLARRWLPVNMYIGGAEHSVLHLLYVRFITKVFRDLGLVSFGEPFPVFRAHGLMIKDGAKMSKSKGNVVNPDEYIKKFGADAVRMYLMFLGPFEAGGDFRDQGITGLTRFLARAKNMQKKIARTSKGKLPTESEKFLHQSIKKITEDIENLRYNTAISQLMMLLNNLEELPSVPWPAYESFLKLLAPFAPYLSEELYQSASWRIKRKKTFSRLDSIHLASWPGFDPKKIIESSFDLVVQINGRVRATIKASVGISEKDAELLVIENENIKKYLEGERPKKTIFVPNKLINFVV